MVPGLLLWLHFDQPTASATSLATITAPAGAALVLFGRAESVDWQFAAYLIVGATLGAWAAARYLDRIPSHWLTRAFAVLMLAAAARLGIA